MLIIEIYFHPRLKSEVKAAINELGRFDILIEDAASYSLEVNLGSKQRAFDKKYCPKTKYRVICYTDAKAQEVKEAAKEVLKKHKKHTGYIIQTRPEDVIVSKQKDTKT